jgi:hypothetical protein
MGIHPAIKKGAGRPFPKTIFNCLQGGCALGVYLSRDDNGQDSQEEEQKAQTNRDAKEDFLDATASCEDAACVAARESAKASAFALQDYTRDERN